MRASRAGAYEGLSWRRGDILRLCLTSRVIWALVGLRVRCPPPGAGVAPWRALCQRRLARMTENQDSLRALRAETLRGLAGQREQEEARRDRGCWCCWLTVPVVLAVAWALPVVWESHLRPWHNAFTSALTDPYTLGGVAVTFTFALYGLLQCIDLGDK